MKAKSVRFTGRRRDGRQLDADEGRSARNAQRRRVAFELAARRLARRRRPELRLRQSAPFPPAELGHYSQSAAGAFQSDADKLKDGNSIQLQAIEDNLVDILWTGKPARPSNPVNILDVQYSGVAVSEKLVQIRADMAKRHASLIFLSALDEIAC